MQVRSRGLLICIRCHAGRRTRIRKRCRVTNGSIHWPVGFILLLRAHAQPLPDRRVIISVAKGRDRLYTHYIYVINILFICAVDPRWKQMICIFTRSVRNELVKFTAIRGQALEICSKKNILSQFSLSFFRYRTSTGFSSLKS